jgi:hypothetical protein
VELQLHAPAALLLEKEPLAPVKYETGVGAVERRKMSCPCTELNHDSSVLEPLA